MGKFVDKVCVAVGIFIIVFIIGIEAIHHTISAMLIAFCISLIITISYAKISNDKKGKTMTLKAFDTYMIIMGIKYQLEVLMALYPSYNNTDKYIFSNKNIIFPIYKFSELSRDDVLKSYKEAKSRDITTVYIISNNISRSTIVFSNYLYDIEFYFVRSKEIYKMLAKYHKIPTSPSKPPKTHAPMRELLYIIIDHSNAPKYILTSIVLFVIGLLTPLTNYYLALSGLSSFMALLTIFSHNNTISKSKLPKIKKDDSQHMS